MDKQHAPEIAKGLSENGIKLVATKGTAEVINAAGIECETVLKISEGRPNIEDVMKNGDITMAINTSDNKTAKDDAVKIRQIVLRMSIPYFTTLSAARAAIDALGQMKNENWNEPVPLQDYLAE